MSDKSAKELSSIYEITNVLASTPDLKRNLRSALAILSSYYDMPRCIVFLKKDRILDIVAAYGLTKEEMKSGVYRMGEGVIGKVAKNGTPIVIPDISVEPVFLNKTKSRSLDKDKKISFIAVPIKIKNEVLGVIGVDKYFNRQTKFEDDLKILKIVAGLFAVYLRINEQFERERLHLLREKEELVSQIKSRYKIDNIIGLSAPMQEIFETVHTIADTRATVLLLGESGTGKELIAKAIHFLSDRKDKPFVGVNCSAIPEGLIESELFGHEKGAFTGATSLKKGKFEIASGGTIFLDEIGDLPLPLQPKLLRVIQEREFERVGGEKTIKVDVRIIAATNRDLEHLVSKGKFREDLYFRLNVIPIKIPPLRERKEDIPLLVEFFRNRFNKEYGKNVNFTERAINRMIAYNWHGNVRELENTVERLVLMSRKETIDDNDLPLNISKDGLSDIKNNFELSYNIGLQKVLENIEKEHIKKALEITGGNRKKAAELLGITERQINYRIKNLDIKV